jgi:hypothetical protein
LFYRIVESIPPTDEDFLPLASKGVERRIGGHRREYESRVSVYDVAVAAEEVMRANQFSWGRYLATVDVPDDGTCEVAKTFRNPHHFTIYLSDATTPARLRSLVVGQPRLIQE